MLLGNTTVASGVDSNDAGTAEAFPFSASQSGTTSSITVYLDSHSRASSLVAGLYTNASGHPGSLLTSGSLSTPAAGAWNTVKIGSTSLVSGTKYWIAVLGTGNALYFRDVLNGACQSLTSRQTSLTSLATSWSTGGSWSTCGISAAVDGAPASVGSGSGGTPPTTTTTSTTSTTPTTTTTTSTTPTTTTTTSTTPTTTTTTSTTPTPPPPPAAPSNTAAPVVSGSATQGQTLSTSKGSWSNSPTSYAYQWRDCDSSALNCTNISGATGSSYAVAGSDVGHKLVAVVTAGNAGGSSSQASAPTAVVTAPSSSASCAGTPGSATPNPASMDACGFPSPDNSGVPAGTALTAKSGDISANTAGETISGLNLNGTITVTANNVTIENSSITTGDGQLNGTSAIDIKSGVTGTVVKYVSMQGSNCQGGSLFAGVMNEGGDQLTMDHDYGHCIDDILHGSGTISNSYSIDNAVIPNDHYEPVADDGGNGALTVNHDTFLDAHDQVAAVFTQCTFGDVATLTIENSLLGGGDFAIYGPTSDPCGTGTGPESVTNNRFTRLYYPNSGQYGVDAYFPKNTTWSGNVWDDTNAGVSGP